MGSLLKGKLTKLVMYDQARVNGGNRYEYPGNFGSLIHLISRFFFFDQLAGTEENSKLWI